MKKSIKIILTTVVALPISCMLFYIYASSPIKGNKYFFPEKHTGWVCVTYNAEGMLPLREEDGYLVAKIPKDGILRTSSRMRTSPVHHEYYYYSEEGVRKAEELGLGGGYSSRHKGKKEITSYFWIGIKDILDNDYKKYVKKENVLSTPSCGLWRKDKNLESP